MQPRRGLAVAMAAMLMPVAATAFAMGGGGAVGGVGGAFSADVYTSPHPNAGQPAGDSATSTPQPPKKAQSSGTERVAAPTPATGSAPTKLHGQ
jgi:hypothetical protein